MKVNNISNVYFKSNVTKPEEITQPKYSQNEIKELPPITPDFRVSTPQKYTKLNVIQLENGLKVHTYKLGNGHTISIVPMEGSPAIVKNYVNVGSMNETKDIKGISHFLEHMAFNGTNGENGHIKLDVGDSFKLIEQLGGWANASTNYAITDYINSTPQLNKNDLEQQIKVIAAMTEDLKLSDEMIEKEKHAVCSEINMILDNPQTISMDQTVRTLFSIKNPTDEMVGGSVKSIKNLKRKDVTDYYNKYYTPDNMNLVITGDVDPEETIRLVSKHFNSKKISNGKKFDEKLTPITQTIRKDFINDKAKSSDIVIGFAGPNNNNARDNIVFKVARYYLNTTNVSLSNNLEKLNTYYDIATEKISTNPNSPTLAYIAANCNNQKTEKVLQEIFNTLANIKIPEQDSIDEIKRNMKRNSENAFQYSSVVNNVIGHSVLNNSLDSIANYNKIIDSITPEEVYNSIKKYFDINKAAITVVHPKAENNISFTGRKPINENKVFKETLNNNFELGLYETKNNNINYNISLILNVPYNKKAGVVEVLDLMYDMGQKDIKKEDFFRYQEKYGVDISGRAHSSGITVLTESDFENREKIYDSAIKMLYEPRLTEENLDIAKKRIKDLYSRKQDCAYSEYYNYKSLSNPYEFSDKEILDNIDNITLKDVEECHKYILENARGIITANIPEQHTEVKNEIKNNSLKLNKVKNNKKELLKVYKPETKTTILQKVNNNSQADIMQVNTFEYNDNNLKEDIVGDITNSILNNSSIGLFNILREKEHLAYSVYSELSHYGNQGEISCNILTTTDNKEIGEYSYDNVQKSINGFNKQIKALKNGEFTEQDLNNAKLAIKADLIENEGNQAKLSNLRIGLNSKHGFDYINKIYEQIDNIQKEDITQFANKIFASPATISIVASKDTLDNNKDFFKQLEES